MKVIITPDYITMSNKYQSPFSPSEINYFMSLMQNDTKATGRGATYAKLEVLQSKLLKSMDAKTMTGAEKLLFIFSFVNFLHWGTKLCLVTLRLAGIGIASDLLGLSSNGSFTIVNSIASRHLFM